MENWKVDVRIRKYTEMRKDIQAAREMGRGSGMPERLTSIESNLKGKQYDPSIINKPGTRSQVRRFVAIQKVNEIWAECGKQACADFLNLTRAVGSSKHYAQARD
jgi:hypothetical protein